MNTQNRTIFEGDNLDILRGLDYDNLSCHLLIDIALRWSARDEYTIFYRYITPLGCGKPLKHLVRTFKTC